MSENIEATLSQDKSTSILDPLSQLEYPACPRMKSWAAKHKLKTAASE